MRKNLTPLFAAFLIFTLFSCSSDDLVSDELGIETADLTVNVDRTSTPCAKNLLSMVSSSTLGLDCLSDLGGQTINFPKNVNLNFEGGILTNGTLHFNGGTIDGRLLSKGLKITGNVSLINDTYTFEPDQWGIKQGSVNDTQAFHNRENLEEAIELVKVLGGTTFEIGALDAYFDVVKVRNTYKGFFLPEVEAINIPSNFHVKLSSNTKIRVQPNNSYEYALFCMNETTGSKLSGGYLYGEREHHNFNGNPRFPSHEWGTLVLVYGAKNAVVENVKMTKSNGDNLRIRGAGYLVNDDYNISRNIKVTGCAMDLARRNGLTVTGGEDVLIENNTFSQTGKDINGSKGTNPRFSIDIEAFHKNVNGKSIAYEKVDGVIVRNNRQENSARGGFLNSVGSNVIFEENVVEDGISYNNGINTIIRNNYLKSAKQGTGTAIGAGNYNQNNIQKNNKIYGNTIDGYDVGIQLKRQDHQVYDNKIINCQMGIQAQFLSDTKIYNNEVKSNFYKSKAINFYFTWCDNVEISGNTFNTSRNAIYLNNVNNGSSNKGKKLTFKNNTINNNYQVTLINTNNIEFDGNKIYTNLELFDSENITMKNNTIDAHKRNTHTIDFRGGVKNINIYKNDLTAPKNKSNTKVDDRVKMNEINEWANEWNYQ